MLLLIRSRYPRLANVLGWISGIVTLAVGVWCGASTAVLILGGGSSIALGLVRYVGTRHPRLVAHRGIAGGR